MTNVTSKLAAAATNDIRGIKPPIEVPDPLAWLWWTLGALAVIAIVLTIWLLLRKKALAPKPVVIISPHVRAKEKLADALRFIGDPKLFCTMVSDTARVYLEERFNLHAPERTTEEFIVELRTSRHLTVDQKQSLGAFLENCDLVKFARFEPTEATLRQLHEAALRLVDETQFVAPSTPATVAFPTSRSTSPDAPAIIHETSPAIANGQPFSLKDRLIGFGLAAGLILLGLAMWIWPYLHLVPVDVDPGGRGGRRLVGLLRLLEWFWSRPVGTIFAILGAFVLYGVFTRRTKSTDP